MNRVTVGLTLGAIAAAALALASAMPAPAAAPPSLVAPASSPAPVAEAPRLPEMPAIDRELARAAYVAARDHGSTEPGMAAFRDHTDRFLAHNAELAAEHAREEGLTLAEIGTLTNFALVTERMQRWPSVEVLVGKPVPAATRTLVAGVVRGDSEEIKLRIREHVAAGDPPARRAETMRLVFDHTLAEYFSLTGMDRAKLDLLLADAVLDNTLEPEPVAEQDAPLADGEVAEVVDEVVPEKRIIVIERVVPPTGAALAEIEAEAGRNPRFAAELERDHLRGRGMP